MSDYEQPDPREAELPLWARIALTKLRYELNTVREELRRVLEE